MTESSIGRTKKSGIRKDTTHLRLRYESHILLSSLIWRSGWRLWRLSSSSVRRCSRTSLRITALGRSIPREASSCRTLIRSFACFLMAAGIGTFVLSIAACISSADLQRSHSLSALDLA